MDSAKFQRRWTTLGTLSKSALGEFFFVRGTCPGGWSGDLVIFPSPGCWGPPGDLESLPALSTLPGAAARGLGGFSLRRGACGCAVVASGPNFAGEDGRGKGRDESKRHRAESQWIVAARPLCHLQYPVAYLSRLQRILPAAR